MLTFALTNNHQLLCFLVLFVRLAMALLLIDRLINEWMPDKLSVS